MVQDAKDFVDLLECTGRVAFLAALLEEKPADVPGDLAAPTIQRIRELCEKFQLSHALNRLARLDRMDRAEMSLAALGTEYRVLAESIMDELKPRQFVYVARKDLYDAPDLFGADVANKFSKATFHIREAGTCLVLGRGTASVYHSMCVLEVGLDSLSCALGLPFSMKNWNVILNEIEAAITGIGPSSGPSWKEDKEFYSKAAIEFKYFREAWRNHTAHGRGTFTDADAEKVLGHVKDFMVHLSKKLQER